ncbi:MULTISPECIES: hypothetical protein [Rhodopseudomonas]|uniref:Uncharacterized protein n=1 Tax=Rhodopseudomonas palustris (strain DX-1) TaxID=652103 RepID=E6VNG0_RHOPX|nr:MULTISPECIES: hypothetical protein [Rhodopseudomonas]NEW88695.1 hypothetical protein [Rhodopseudomonas sp. WA056]QDL98067.1 hypothetical protein FLL57_12435 [Rhodopseudomonas palustris]
MSALRRQWLWPIALAASTLIGLLAALIGEGGVWRSLCWVALGLPLATIAVCLLRLRNLPPSARQDPIDRL